MNTPKKRVIVWFSCGAASAVAAYNAVLVCSSWADVHVVYCDTSKDEHEDNARFRSDVEKWIGKEVEIIQSAKYQTCDEVYEDTSYMSGIKGARCTMELKRLPRLKYQQDDDIHVFGFTADEEDRIADFETNNPFIKCLWVLRDHRITKQDCFKELSDAGIALPAMYLLGFKNNNCKGCVKATSPGYWNKTRVLFPDVFDLRAKRSRELGVRLVRVKGERLFLDELPCDANGNWKDLVIEENVSCGPQCGIKGGE